MFIDNAEDFPKVAVDAYPTVFIGVKFVSTFVDWGDQSLVPNIGEDARAEDDVLYGICGTLASHLAKARENAAKLL